MPVRRPAFKVFHALQGAAHADRAVQFFGFGASEVGNRHRHAKKLVLKERYGKGTLQDWFER